MSRKRALPVNTKYSGEDFDTDYDDDERSNGKNIQPDYEKLEQFLRQTKKKFC